MTDEDQSKWEKIAEEGELEEAQEQTEEPIKGLELSSRDEIETELNEAIDKAMRATAELQNVRRRTDEEIARIRKFAIEDFAKSLIPIVDSLDEGMKLGTKEIHAADSIHEGLELTHKLFIDVLSKHHIQVIDPKGEAFDPNLHEAMSKVPSEDHESNSVIEVIQKGYVLHDRLLRPARVVVAA